MDLATQDTTQVAPATESTQIEPSMEQTIAEDWKKITMPREGDGTFKAVIGENTLNQQKVSHETTEIQKPTVVVTEKTATDTIAPPVEDKAPSSWRKESAAKWASLDPELKAEINKRETDFHKGNEGYKAKAAFADEVQRAVMPYENNFKALGIPMPYAIKTMFEAENMLRNGTPEQKAQMFHRWARDYSVDLNSANISNDPYVADLQQKVSNYEALLQKQQYDVQSQSHAELTSKINEFAKDHEHFETVRVAMGALLSAGVAQELQDAYDQACGANPDIRATLFAKQQEEAKAKARLVAEEAKRAGATNVNTRGTLPAAKAVGTIDDTIREKARELGWNP